MNKIVHFLVILTNILTILGQSLPLIKPLLKFTDDTIQKVNGIYLNENTPLGSGEFNN